MKMNIYNLYNLFLLISLSKIVLPKCQSNQNYCNKCNPLTDSCAICTKIDVLIPDDEGGCVPKKKMYSWEKLLF